MIQKKRNKSKGLPAIRGLDRMDKKAYSVLYDTGCVLLYELELEIGTDSFLQLFKQITKNKTDSAERLLKILCNLAGTEVSNRFKEQLSR